METHSAETKQLIDKSEVTAMSPGPAGLTQHEARLQGRPACRHVLRIVCQMQ